MARSDSFEMTTERQCIPQKGESPGHRNTEISNGLAVRLAAAEEAARQDRKRIAEYELLVKGFASLPPTFVGKLINKLSVEEIIGLLKQVPAFIEPLKHWSEQYFKSAERLDIVQDVQRLEALGVKRESMAIAMTAICFSPFFDKPFAQLGDKRKRRERAKRLLIPLPDLHDLAKEFGQPPALVAQKIPNPSRIIAELKFLSSMLSWGEFIYDSLGANHLLEVSKFALASLVHDATGRFLDREVSYLICVALNDYNYDENRHRVWRINNYDRLQQKVPIVTRILIALNTVVTVDKPLEVTT
jgi:hypothetical protein